tara:strand:+ start:160 stop:348 length:189 start_codon:yes stop_codon:yes gene_type:complete
MPIWLRNFTINEIIKYKKEETKSIEKSVGNKNATSAKMGDPVPDHIKNTFKQASYTTRKAKK